MVDYLFVRLPHHLPVVGGGDAGAVVADNTTLYYNKLFHFLSITKFQIFFVVMCYAMDAE